MEKKNWATPVIEELDLKETQANPWSGSSFDGLYAWNHDTGDQWECLS